MMKIIGFLFVIVLAVEKSCAGPEEVAQILAECKALEKVADVDLMNFQNNVKLDTRGVKCLTTCFMEKMQLISNKQINRDGCMKFVRTLPNFNEKLVQSLNEIMDECKSIQELDRCEYGSKTMACFKDGAVKRQISNIFM